MVSPSVFPTEFSSKESSGIFSTFSNSSPLLKGRLRAWRVHAPNSSEPLSLFLPPACPRPRSLPTLQGAHAHLQRVSPPPAFVSRTRRPLVSNTSPSSRPSAPATVAVWADASAARRSRRLPPCSAHPCRASSRQSQPACAPVSPGACARAGPSRVLPRLLLARRNPAAARALPPTARERGCTGHLLSRPPELQAGADSLPPQDGSSPGRRKAVRHPQLSRDPPALCRQAPTLARPLGQRKRLAGTFPLARKKVPVYQPS